MQEDMYAAGTAAAAGLRPGRPARAPQPRPGTTDNVATIAPRPADDRAAALSVTQVLVVEHGSLLRAGVQTILEGDRRTMVAAQVDGWSRVVDVRGRLRSDAVVVAGSSCVARDGAAALHRHVADGCALGRPVVLLVAPEEEDALLCGVKAGIRGLVSPQQAPNQLAAAVTAVARGEAFVSCDIASVLLNWFAARLPEGTVRPERVLADLTAREREILELLGEGLSNGEIANQLGIQETTVRSHVYHISIKLKLKNRTEAVLLGYQYALVANG